MFLKTLGAGLPGNPKSWNGSFIPHLFTTNCLFGETGRNSRVWEEFSVEVSLHARQSGNPARGGCDGGSSL